MNDLYIFDLRIPPVVYVPAFYFLYVGILMIFKLMGYSKIKKLAEKTQTDLDDILLEALDIPLMLVIFVSGIYIIENIFKFGMNGEIRRVVDIAFKATSIIALILFVDKLVAGLIRHFSKGHEVLKSSSGFLVSIFRGIILGLGLLVILDSCGISVTPILASLGVGSLAVALALQPTLENLFSGAQLIVDKPIKVGHFIKLESGEEGYVEKIGWRSTWLRMLPNNMIVIPNKILVNSRVLNYHYPDQETAVPVEVGVDYRSDLEKVERITIEVAAETLKSVQGGVRSFQPVVRFSKFNESSIDFTVVLRAKEYVDGVLLKHEFIKNLHKRYAKEGIVIPYPIRTIEWDKSMPPIKIENTQGGK